MMAVPKYYKMAPYGWELQGSHLEPVAEEQLVLRHIRLHAAFGASTFEIAKNLTRDGFSQSDETPWTAQAIEELLSYTDEPLWQDWLDREMAEDF
jgi:hypothetical protein